MLLSEIVFMDFEASALRDGYPVEVGWAWVEGSDVHAESLLISPADEWLTPGFTWDPIAEGIHGLSLARLRAEGVAPPEVCDVLNERLHDKIAIFDTGPDGVDRLWLDMLFTEGEQVRSFRLGGPAGELLQTLAAEYGIADTMQAKIRAMVPPINHRAAQDAAHYAWRAAAVHCITGSSVGEAEAIMAQIAVRGFIRQ